ncbi:MAG: hypothetical protein HXX10_19905 [Rhodoplanes sp.]|uniref:hypothetical protein n=1 Tax=Rhodoplanes sp. TaxID=1968906 RepID=UPI001794EC3E|nr:hypothetical protein [Rhodoplanes sp.]NVO16300.1 hypothetical protein [Rhodoplanes sp.]
MSRRTIISLGAAALAGLFLAASIPSEADARGGRGGVGVGRVGGFGGARVGVGGGVYRGGVYRGGGYYRGPVYGGYRGPYVRPGVGWGLGAAAVGAAAGAAAYGAYAPYGYGYPAYQCGYYPYPACY